MPLSATISLSAKSMEIKSPVVVSDYSAHDQQIPKYVTLGMNSASAVPVYIDGDPFGTLGFGSKLPNHYDERKFEVVAAVASVVGMMIAKAELQQTNDVEASIGRIISAAPVGADFFERFTTEVRKVIDFDRVTLNSVDVKANTFVTEFLFENQIPNFPIGKTRDAGGTVLAAVIKSRTGQCFQFDDEGSLAPEFLQARPFLFDGQPYFLSIPLIVGDQVIGTMGIIRGSIPFSQKDLAIATRLGNLVAGVFADYKQKEFRSQAEWEVQKNRNFLEVEANIGRIVSSPLVGPDVFERFVAEVGKIIEFDRLVLNSLNLEEGTFISEFLFGEAVPNFPIGETLALEGTAILEGVKSRKVQSVTLIASEEGVARYKFPDVFIATGERYLIDMPLIVGDQVIGSMGINRSAAPFSQEEMATATRLANLIAGAFADYKQQEYRVQAEGEIYRNKTILEAEAAIGRILSAPSNMPGASQALTMELSKIISLDRHVILSVDLETETFTQEFSEFVYDPEVIVANNPGQTYLGSITGEVIRTGAGQVINSDDPRLASGKIPLSKMVFEQGYRSLMAVPLRFEGEIIGTFICSRRDGVYSEGDIVVGERIGTLLAGALATVKITNERNQAQLALTEADRRLRQIADNIGGVFWLVELAPHRLIYASPNAENVWDLPLAEIYENFRQIFRNIHPDDIPIIQQHSIGADKTGVLDIEYRIIKRDGSTNWLRSRGFPVFSPDGELYRMSGFAEDITKQKMELERITEAGRLLSVGELASGVAHEINNPLAAINLYSEALLEQGLPSSVTDDIKIISAQGKRAAGIVLNLLQFSRKSTPEVTTVHAEEFIESCVDLKRHDFRVNNISGSISVLLDQPEITIDKQLMTQVMVNILSNAEQACVAAHRDGHISISVRDIDGSTRISISDDGIGIPSEILSKVFDPFFTTKQAGEGTGLGLSVSYGIITQLGGELWAESDGVSGSTFHIDVPREAAEQSTGLEPVEPLTEEPSDADGLPKSESSPATRVLVVDDERDLREVVVKLLERRGHTTEQAGDGEEAWSKLQEGSYDCILLDLRMPGLSGQELFERLTVSDPDAATKVVFVTGDLTNASTRAFLEPLDNRVLNKPASLEDLENAIELVASARPDKA